jgi:iron complex outermembrane receptor protein
MGHGLRPLQLGVLADSDQTGVERLSSLNKCAPAAVAVLLLPQAALPQVGRLGFEEITVTARKQEETLLEVPVAVSVFDSATIAELGLLRLEDVARFTPGFSFESDKGRQPSSYRPAIRGLTTIRNGIANTSAATTFIDGVYVGGSVQPTELYNLERVEIMRGPQAAQYGRGTYAGAINYVTRAPGDALRGEIKATGAEHSTYGFNAWVSGPLTEALGFFAAAGYSEYGGEYDNTRDGQKLGDEEAVDVTAKLAWAATPALSVAAKIGWQSTDDGHFPVYLQPRELNNCCERTPEAPRAREYFVGTASRPQPVNLSTDLLDAAGGAGAELDRWLATLRVAWSLPAGMQLTSLTGYVDDEAERGFDLSFAGYDPLFFAVPGLFTKRDKLEQTDVSQELRLSSAQDRDWRWSAGLYTYKGKFEETADQRVYLDGDDIVVAPSPSPLTREQANNVAMFGSLEHDLSDRWTLGAELRWSADQVKVRNRANDGTNTPLEAPFADTSNSWNPRFTAEFAAREDLRVYASVAKGTKPADFNPEVPDEKFRFVDEEAVWSYEVGVKGSQTGRASYALAAYRMDVDDQQLTTLAELPDGRTVSLTTNANETRIYGVETEFDLRLSDTLRLGLTYSWVDATYRDHVSVDQADLRGSDGSIEATNRLGNVSGNRLPRVPVNTASAVLDYHRPLPGFGRGFLVADWSYQSSRYAQEHNLIETGDQQLVGLRVGVAADAWELSLWARNLLDDDTPVDIQRHFDLRSGFLPVFPQAGDEAPSGSPRGFGITLPRGRQFGATLRLHF